MRTEATLNPAIGQWALQAVTRLLGTYGIVQGLGILVGGKRRWYGPSYSAALNVPGAPQSWGFAILLLGLLLLIATYTNQIPNMRSSIHSFTP